MREIGLIPFFFAVVVCLFADRAEAAVYNLHLVTDSVPDYTDMPSLARSATALWQTPQDKCIAVWRWGRRSRRQTSCASEDGRTIWDPILHYNSYGSMNCGIISSLNIACWLELGYRAHYVQLGDHTVSEVSWDDGATWHLFDSSMSAFCYNHQGVVASCDEIKRADACELSGGKSERGHYYFYHIAPPCGSHLGPTGWRFACDNPVENQRTLFNGADSYMHNFSVDRYCQYARTGHRYVLNVRPYECYTRYWRPLDRPERAGTSAAHDPDYFRPVSGRDPDDPHGPQDIRGNGQWVFQPDLAAKDWRECLYDEAGLAANTESGGPKLHPAAAGRAACAVFKISAANVITSMRIEADGLRRTEADVLKISVSRSAGMGWSPLWQAEKTGPQPIRLKLRDEVAGVTQCLIKIEMLAAAEPDAAGLDALKVTTTTQLNRRTLPSLSLGSNQVMLWADEQVETSEVWPPLHDGAYKRTAAGEDNVFSDREPDGFYKATLGSGVNGKQCSVTWKLEVPSDISDVTYNVVSTNRTEQSYVSLQHSWDGVRFVEFDHDASGGFPMDKQVHHTIRGSDVPSGARQAQFRGVFFCKSAAATYNMPGIEDLLFRIRHKPRNAAFAPIEVTYQWTEHRASGDVVRSHTELVAALPHRWTINVAGKRDPTMNWVRTNLRGHGPDGAAARYGYSDGEDVGLRDAYPKVAYRWGKELARGKSYTASRPSSKTSGNPDSDGRELTNGIVIAPTDYVTAQAVQSATAFWDPGEPVTFVVDLGAVQAVGGFRAWTHQPNDHFCHPQRIDAAVSTDGRTWQAAGTIHHDDLWKPPGDFEAWEHDDDPRYAALPAAGRLAYGFPLALEKPLPARFVRLVCTPLEGKGMGLSEFQVFDAVSVLPWPGNAALPALFEVAHSSAPSGGGEANHETPKGRKPESRTMISHDKMPSTTAFPPDRTTKWVPGLMAVGGIPSRSSVFATIQASTYGNGTLDASAGIQAALDRCPAGQVLQLSAGTFLIQGEPLAIKKGITLRGAGATSTTLCRANGAKAGSFKPGAAKPVLIIGPNRWPHSTNGTSHDLAADGAKGACSVRLASAPAGGLSQGQIVLIDELSGAAWQSDPAGRGRIWAAPDWRVAYQRHDPPQPTDDPFPSAAAWFSRPDRVTAEIKEVRSYDAPTRTVTFTSPLHISYRTANNAQLTVYAARDAHVKYAGVEDLKMAGGDDGNLRFEAAAYSWASGVELTGWLGEGVAIDNCFRVEIRGCYVHSPVWFEPGGGSYNISLAHASSEVLIENNISVDADKVMVMRCAGAASVVGYNYTDDGHIDSNPGWMESGINGSHMVGPHHVLFEGNYAFNFDSDKTHGNAVCHTVFRNHLSGKRRSFADKGNVRCAGLGFYSYGHSFAGNVLGLPGEMSDWVYESQSLAAKSVWKLGYDEWPPYPRDPQVVALTHRHGNFDYLTCTVHWASGYERTLPDSLYLGGKPAFFNAGRGYVWPWVDPTGTPPLRTLPAKVRYDAGTPFRQP
ncbi:MAG: hypothetical protein ABSG68_09460 [Thermoguttaceae bacterium]|jgi:hypothetical protein